MKKALTILATGLMLGAFAASQAKLPEAKPKTDAEKSAEADKAKSAKAKDDSELAKAQDKAVANYKKNHAAMGKK